MAQSMDLEVTGIRRGLERGKNQTFVIKIFRNDKIDRRTCV
jgi:hypothetical protein